MAKPPPRNRRLRTPEPEEEELAHATTPLASVPPPPSERRLAKTWARIRRPVVLVLQAAMVLGATAGAIAIGRLVRNYLHTSPHFAIETLEVAGHDRVNEEELLQTAGLATGNNIFEVSPEQATEQLLAHPWVANAVVERRLPGTLRVEVEERHAVAALSMDDGLYLVGDDATLFKAIEDGDPVDHPVVTGIARARFVGDRAYRTSVLVEVVALLHDYRMAGLWRREPISEIHIQDNDDVTLHVGSDGMEVRLGRGPFLRKLRKLRRVLDRLGDERALYVYLDNVRRPDRVTVRLREIELPPDPEATPETATES
ncbi:MAG: FtsQ-type POTRA domain-containing protein [Myxococcota bacterium]